MNIISFKVPMKSLYSGLTIDWILISNIQVHLSLIDDVILLYNTTRHFYVEFFTIINVLDILL